MMQTVIKKNMAVGIPGTHGNGQPYFADPYIVGAADGVTMGGIAQLDDNGNAIVCSDASKAVGIYVNPNEHVRMVLPTDTASLVVPQGATVAIAKKGSWYVAIPSADKANWKKGVKLNYSTSGFVYNASGTAAEVLLVDDEATVALIRFL